MICFRMEQAVLYCVYQFHFQELITVVYRIVGRLKCTVEKNTRGTNKKLYDVELMILN